jgi:hypothetical protein
VPLDPLRGQDALQRYPGFLFVLQALGGDSDVGLGGLEALQVFEEAERGNAQLGDGRVVHPLLEARYASAEGTLVKLFPRRGEERRRAEEQSETPHSDGAHDFSPYDSVNSRASQRLPAEGNSQ